MTTVSDICDAIGRARLGAALGVRKTAISNAVVQGKFPAKWFRVIRDLTAEAGVECPDELFSFVEPEASSEAKEAAE